MESDKPNIAHRTRNASRKDTVEKPAPKPEKRRRKPDYIPPLSRRLGPYANLVKPPVSSLEVSGPIDLAFKKITGLLVKNTAPDFSSEFLCGVSNLASEYMCHLFTSLHELTEVQRHSRPGVADLQMCLDQHYLTPTDLYHQYERTLQFPKELRPTIAMLKAQVEKSQSEFYAENYTLDKDDPSLVFHANEQYEIAALVPRQSKKRNYIPDYLPDLPPDYTYQDTGHYMSTLTDLKQIKLKLVEESRLNEASLYKLIDNENPLRDIDKDISMSSYSDLESDDDGIMSDVGARSISDVESPAEVTDKSEQRPEEKLDERSQEKKEEKAENILEKMAEDSEENIEAKQNEPQEASSLDTPQPIVHKDKKFDFVGYAQKCRLATERKAKELELRRQKRQKDIFLRAEKSFSCYAEGPPSLSEREYFKKVLDGGFKKVIRATRIAERKKKEKIAELLARKAQAEQELEKDNAFEFGFAFNHASNLSDSEEEDMPIEFDFGDEKDEVISEKPSPGQLAGKAPPNNISDNNVQDDGERGDIQETAESNHTDDVDDMSKKMNDELDSVLNAAEESTAGVHSDWQMALGADADSDEDELEDL
ncbi:hypothetical protein E0198_000889 [Clavispora lusitaniae]|nr:hypothetical protein E0198_000889 [Clavispora lusitaniae]